MWWQIILAIIVPIALLIVICFVLCLIVDWKVDKEFKKEQKERSIVEHRLTESLKTLCCQLGIELSYHKELGDAAGRILYYKKAGRILDDISIQILESLKDEPYVLAHELGHYMAIKERQDRSEEGADAEADKLCRLILNKKEQELLSISLRCYFHGTEEDK